MTQEEKNIIWLDMFPSLGYAKKKKLLDLTPQGADIKQVFLTSAEMQKLVSPEDLYTLKNHIGQAEFDAAVNKFGAEGIEFVSIYDPRYPAQLKTIQNPPLCLYCMGNLQLLNSPCLGIVGSRKPTDYGVVVTRDYAKEISQAGLTIVSGMAVGVDSLAHKAALDNNGATIAVLGGGFHHIYPSVNISLFRELVKNNLVITEVSPNLHPEAFLFRLRNRIIAGLSQALVVTEAAEKSGSLLTCNYAHDFNRPVFAVPGKINAPFSQGCNMAIKSGLASITLAPSDVLASLNINLEKQKKPAIQLDFKQQIVIDYIQFEKKSFQEIAEFTHIPANELNAILLGMELDGLVYKLANNSYIMA